jgi:predicted DNA-binding transcriptional regulator AlpA
LAGDFVTNRLPVEVLTIPQVAERLKVSRYTVYRMISAGVLRAVDISVPQTDGSKRTWRQSRTRVRVDDLQAYLDANTREVS